MRLLAAETDPAFHRLLAFYPVRPSPAGGPGYHLGRRQLLDRTHIGTGTKNRRARMVRITPEIAKILAELPGEVGRLFPGPLMWCPTTSLKPARPAKVKARLHDLRHTYASHLLMSGAQLPVVQKLLVTRTSKQPRFTPTWTRTSWTKPC